MVAKNIQMFCPSRVRPFSAVGSVSVQCVRNFTYLRIITYLQPLVDGSISCSSVQLPDIVKLL